MNKYYIIIPLLVLTFITIIYYIVKFVDDIYTSKKGLEKYGELNIPNCVVDTSDNDCKELNNLDLTYDFTQIQTYNKTNVLYTIKLIANFLKYLNSDYTKNSFNINNLFNQKLIKSDIDDKPIGISYSNQDKTQVFYIFRGSQTAADLMGDVTYNYYDDDSQNNNNIKIHKFYNLIYKDVKQQLKDCVYSNTTDIYIFGHSMGAAIGFILAQDLSTNFNNKYNVNIIGIAPPRVGNQKFIDSLKANCKYVLGVINMADIVPTIPYSYMPNLIKPFTPVEYAQITPALIFNKLNTSINACHQPITYYMGIKNNNLTYLA